MKYVFKFVLTLLFFTGCKPDDPIVAPEGTKPVSEITTNTNYEFPLSLYNNTNAKIYLNNNLATFVEGVLKLPSSGFYEMIIMDGGNSDTIVFNLLDPERGESEWGLKKWTPAEPIYSNQFVSSVELIYPKNNIPGIIFPFVVYLNNSANGFIDTINTKGQVSISNKDFSIKNGVGSIQMSSNEISTGSISVGSQTISFSSQLITESITLSGTLSDSVSIPENTIVYIENHLQIPINSSLKISPGCIVLVSPGVNITNFGPIYFSGTKDNPILMTCSEKDTWWGGFISEGDKAKIVAQYTFFCYSGFNETGSFILGHAKRQALFQTSSSSLSLTSCYILDNIGQIFYPTNSILNLDRILVQRAKTGGQLNNSPTKITNSIFTDFPDDSQTFQDNDNDALYISESNLSAENTLFMYAKDDGIDSGGSLGGEVSFKNCIFQACFHEGAALSSEEPNVKKHIFKNCTFKNNGQGLELGYSSSGHEVYIDSCSFTHNLIGIRYGDNYPWKIAGKIFVSNSVSLFNEIDVWNMVHESWKPYLKNMEFENTFISKKSTQYPKLLTSN